MRILKKTSSQMADPATGKRGYSVWCDVTKLLGGEKFWEDIQDAIANRTAKFVFALSQSSNHKTGPLDELNCALGAEKKLKTDFIVTLKLDDLTYEDVYIGIQRRNHIDFQSHGHKAYPSFSID
jgi:hypothetical protein